MVRRALILLVLAAGVASIMVAAVVLAQGPRVTAPLTKAAHPAPRLQVPPFGYSCEVATSNGCSLHPCVRYASDQVTVAVANAATVASSARSGRCASTAKATPREIPIVGP